MLVIKRHYWLFVCAAAYLAARLVGAALLL